MLGMQAIFGAPLYAQDQAGVHGPYKIQIAIVELDELFARTRYGQAVQNDLEVARRALLAENEELEAGLEAEEKALTTRRPGMNIDEFQPLAKAFDEKVEKIRDSQERKGRELAQRTEAERQRFFKIAVPVLENLMTEIGAVVLMDKSKILLSRDVVDITERAVVRIDAVLGDGKSPANPFSK